MRSGSVFGRWAAVLAVLLTLTLPAAVGSRDVEAQILSSYLVPYSEAHLMPQVADRYEVVRRSAEGYEIIVPADQAKRFQQMVPQARILQADIGLKAPVMKAFNLEGDYRTFDGILAEAEQLAKKYPDLVQVVQYGQSQQGHPLFAIKVSDNVTEDEAEPELMLTAATHGDEIITTEILLNLMHRMLEGRASNSRFANMINEREIFFIPVVNPDGFVRRLRYDNNVDPNRSYPYPGNPNAKPTASIAGLIEFFHSREFVGSIDFHAFGEMVMYPWAYTYDSIPAKDAEALHQLAESMAAQNGYAYGPISKVIYVAKGSSADYYYWKKQTAAIAIEVGTSKYPNPRQIPAYTEEQAESLWRFIEFF